jgi:hypothetical protein
VWRSNVPNRDDLYAGPSTRISSPASPPVMSTHIDNAPLASTEDPIYNRFSPVEDPIDEDVDPYETGNIDSSDEDSSDEDLSDDNEETGSRYDSPHQFNVNQDINVEVGPSTNFVPVPLYVPPCYTNLDWTTIAQNAPVTAWMENMDAA